LDISDIDTKQGGSPSALEVLKKISTGTRLPFLWRWRFSNFHRKGSGLNKGATICGKAVQGNLVFIHKDCRPRLILVNPVA